MCPHTEIRIVFPIAMTHNRYMNENEPTEADYVREAEIGNRWSDYDLPDYPEECWTDEQGVLHCVPNCPF